MRASMILAVGVLVAGLSVPSAGPSEAETATAPMTAPTASARVSGTVTDGKARFQVITPTLIRMEYAADRRFEDRPTLTVGERGRRRPPAYTSRVEGKWRVIRTSRVELRWKRGTDFSKANLVMRFRDGNRTRTVSPQPGAQHRYLGGWTRALDLSSGPEPLNPGVLTREGWVVVDDSATALLVDEGPGFDVRPEREGVYRDWFAFGYGHDLRRGLRDLHTLTGPAPLLPRNAFGVWFSKYFPYTEAEFRDLVARFGEEKVPLDMLSLDTDYKRINDPAGAAVATNIVGLPGRAYSWNGWDWNTDLFADPSAFVSWLRKRGISAAANIHPSINSNDPAFPAADATAGGLASETACRPMQADATGDCHIFDWTDERQLEAYFDLHDTFADTGIDAFWLDWCCEAVGAADAPGLSPDTWINSRYAAYQRSLGSRWPVISRIGASYLSDGVYGDRGVGAGGTGALAEHRYSLHFTGDTCATWEMLAFEAEHTAAESAIGNAYVSHDIGSFNGEPQGGQCNAVAAAQAKAPLSDDIYVRWLQFGAFQPIDRLHSNHGARLPWEYDGGATRDAVTAALRLRGQLVPYTYTAARRAHDTGLPITGPMYLSWPRQAEAYQHPTQFTFGRDLVVAPVTMPGTTASVDVWVPPGQWVERTTGHVYRGPTTTTMTVGLDRIPVLVRAGAVLPSHRVGVNAGPAPRDRIVLTAYPGRSGRGQLYDDAGDGLAYERGKSTRTVFTQRRSGGVSTVRIGPALGSFRGARKSRSWEVSFVDVGRPRVVLYNGGVVRRWTYDKATRTVRVVLRALSTQVAHTVTVRHVAGR